MSIEEIAQGHCFPLCLQVVLSICFSTSQVFQAVTSMQRCLTILGLCCGPTTSSNLGFRVWCLGFMRRPSKRTTKSQVSYHAPQSPSTASVSSRRGHIQLLGMDSSRPENEKIFVVLLADWYFPKIEDPNIDPQILQSLV